MKEEVFIIKQHMQRNLYSKYHEIKRKMKEAKRYDNMPMFEHYRQELKTVRMTLGIIGVHIDGINR